MLPRMSDADAITRLNLALEGRYRIEREIGQGGMATVCLATAIPPARREAMRRRRLQLHRQSL